ncbi:MAG: AAA family ATPase [Sedimentisphaerales bacterium]|nr:AAA family ATPase [Sedimentisphaerales bacterium]
MQTETVRLSRQELLNELEMHGAQIRSNGAIQCPFHDDRNPSAGVYRGDDGVWRFKCHGCGFGGDIFDVRARALNKPLGEVLPKRDQKPQRDKQDNAKHYAEWDLVLADVPGRIEQVYRYTNPTTGHEDLIVIRYIPEDGKKKFRQVQPVPGGFALKAPPKPWPLYNRTRILQADTVIVVEGEKCVHALQSIGITATTSPCGAGKAEYCDWSPLAGRNVVLWPDNDSNGREHMHTVRRRLETLTPKPGLTMVEPFEMGCDIGKDAADVITELMHTVHGNTGEANRLLMQGLQRAARPVGPAGDVQEVIEQTIRGERKTIGWPWTNIADLTNALLPGTVTLLCGDPGSAKSFMLIEAVAWWHAQGVKVAVYELEEDRSYHLLRALAQLANQSDVTDCGWVARNAEQARQMVAENQDKLDSLGFCIWEAPDRQCSRKELVEWIEARAKDGCRVIAIDPVTAVAEVENTWVADSEFMSRIKHISRQYGVSLVLVTHPKKTRKAGPPQIQDMAGGAAYERFAQTILWLQHLKGYKSMPVMTACGTTAIEFNRSVYLAKTRNGRGAGTEIAFRFDGQSLRFAEQGVIVKDQSTKETTE